MEEERRDTKKEAGQRLNESGDLGDNESVVFGGVLWGLAFWMVTVCYRVFSCEQKW